MKSPIQKNVRLMLGALLGLSFFSACSSENTEPMNESVNSETAVLSQIEKDALNYMLEEERLAKDSFVF